MKEVLTLIADLQLRIRVIAHYEKMLGVFYFTVDIMCERCGTITDVKGNFTLDKAMELASLLRDVCNSEYGKNDCSQHDTRSNSLSGLVDRVNKN